MRLEISDNNNTRYIRVVESIRITDSNGKRANRKKIIANIGPVSKFDDGLPDFEGRLKASFKACHPLISQLEPFVPKAQPLDKYSFQISESSPECIGHPRIFSHLLIDRIMDELGLFQVLRSYKGFSKLRFDLLGYFRLLVYGRILNPASKIATVAQNSSYFEPIIDDDYPFHIYDTLDFIHDHKKQIFNRMNSKITERFSRRTDIIYYDVTNFYFETDDPDDPVTDENGNILKKGLRQIGVSKENRKQPIVQMGLFMDNSGIPISYEVFPGNTLDHQTVRTSLKNSVDGFDRGRFIFVGDRGMCTYTNLLNILSSGNGYLVSKSIAKSKKKEKEWIFDDSDYIVKSENFKYKSRIVVRNEKDEYGKTVKITEKVVVYWDKYFCERQTAENKSFLEFLDKLMESPSNFRITASQARNIRRFLKKEYLNTDTGELTQASVLKAMIDHDKVEEYRKTYGYYQIVTSELDKSESEIIDIYHGLSRIEDQFRVMKGDLSTRPMYVKTPEHIEAHLAVCTIALTVLRMLQTQVVGSGLLPDNGKTWSYGMSAEKIQRALNKWTVEEIADGYYRFNDLDDHDLDNILKAFDIDLPRKLYKRSELRSLKGKIKLQMGT
jgi:transposase